MAGLDSGSDASTNWLMPGQDRLPDIPPKRALIYQRASFSTAFPHYHIIIDFLYPAS